MQYALFDSMLLLMPKGASGGGGGGQSSDQILEKLAEDMLRRMPIESEKYMFGLPFKVLCCMCVHMCVSVICCEECRLRAKSTCLVCLSM